MVQYPGFPLDFAAYFASLSAVSFRSTSIWPGTQIMLILVSGCSTLRASMLSRTEQMIDCPDCFCGLVVAVIAAWLLVYMLQVAYFLELECTMSTANLMATSSAAYTFCTNVLLFCFC
jgi:hypothetical protein